MRQLVEIDQSNRIENSGTTYIALSNDIKRVIKITSRTKNACFKHLKGKGKTKNQAKFSIFASGILVLIKPHLKEVHKISIDNEYDSHQKDIKSILIRAIRKYKLKNIPIIEIKSVGKGSDAHKLAISAYRKKYKKLRTVNFQELKKHL